MNKKNILITFIILASVFGLGYFYGQKDFGENNNLDIQEYQKKDVLGVDSKKDFYKILKIFDGDTIQVLYQGQKKSVRVLGVNTPEVDGPYRKRECFGKEASEYAKKLLKNKKVMIEFDSSQSKFDKYGRILAYLWVDGKWDFGEKMIRDGYAYEYTYHGRKYKYQKKYKEAQKFAEKNKVGLWADDACGR